MNNYKSWGPVGPLGRRQSWGTHPTWGPPGVQWGLRALEYMEVLLLTTNKKRFV